MLTRNYIIALLNPTGTSSRPFKSTGGVIHINPSNPTTELACLAGFSAVKKPDMPFGGSNAKSTFVLGTGNTAPTVFDYDLESEVDYTDFAIANASQTSVEGNEANYLGFQKIYRQTWIYTGSTPITIKEVGLIVAYQYSGNFYDLVAREVLDSPITVNNGDTFTVSMTIG